MYTKPFTEFGREDAAIAGGKGASLGELTRAGVPVPPGFVVLADAFERFLDATDLRQEVLARLDDVDTAAVHTAEQVSAQLRELIEGATMPEEIAAEIRAAFAVLGAAQVAVRSSATSEDGAEHAWAGQLESFLNTTEETLIENVQRCWASLFTPRALVYRIEKGLREERISVAVVVQAMVESEASGVAFSVHPVTEEENQLIIEAAYGLGEAVVSGAITPDSYVVEKEPRRIIDHNVVTQSRGIFGAAGGSTEWRELPAEQGAKQVLTDEQILELSELVVRIERHYGFPCDIEWAFRDGRFFIVQSRPITTLVGKAPSQPLDVASIAELPWYPLWEARASLFAVQLSMNVYVEPMRAAFGFAYQKILISHERGVSRCYLLAGDADSLGAQLCRMAEREPAIVGTWSADLYRTTDELNALYAQPPAWFLEPAHLARFVEALSRFGVAQMAVKEFANYAPASARAEHTAELEAARVYSERIYHDFDVVCNGFLELLAKRTGYPIELVASATPAEVAAYLVGESLPSHERLAARYACSGVYFTPEPRELSGEETRSILAALARKVTGAETSLVQGSTAYPGTHTGRCRVVRDFSAAADLAPGDVLVTGMTDPRFVQLMKKAGAIVTDAGGVLSHAAIVARELQIPCVIGTTIATQVLKEGDLVEVDADAGVVRVLERAQ